MPCGPKGEKRPADPPSHPLLKADPFGFMFMALGPSTPSASPTSPYRAERTRSERSASPSQSCYNSASFRERPTPGLNVSPPSPQ